MDTPSRGGGLKDVGRLNGAQKEQPGAWRHRKTPRACVQISQKTTCTSWPSEGSILPTHNAQHDPQHDSLFQPVA